MGYSCDSLGESLRWIEAIVEFVRPLSFLKEAHLVNLFKDRVWESVNGNPEIEWIQCLANEPVHILLQIPSGLTQAGLRAFIHSFKLFWIHSLHFLLLLLLFRITGLPHSTTSLLLWSLCCFLANSNNYNCKRYFLFPKKTLFFFSLFLSTLYYLPFAIAAISWLQRIFT